MFHRHETANYTHINTHLLQLSNTLAQLPAHATQHRTSVSISSYYWATEESSTSCTLWYCYVLIVFFFFFLSFFLFFLEKYKTNTTMVLIVTARDTHNTRSIRIWWQREFFFSFVSQQKAKEIVWNWFATPPRYILETAFKEESQ